MKTAFRITSGIFGGIAAIFKFTSHIILTIIFAGLAVLSLLGSLVAHSKEKNLKMKKSKKKKSKSNKGLTQSWAIIKDMLT